MQGGVRYHEGVACTRLITPAMLAVYPCGTVAIQGWIAQVARDAGTSRAVANCASVEYRMKSGAPAPPCEIRHMGVVRIWQGGVPMYNPPNL